MSLPGSIPQASAVDRSQRQHARYAHEAAVTLSLPGVSHHGRTNNVSRGGLCATFLDAVPLGRAIEIDLQLVFVDESSERHSEPLRLPGRVVWCTEVDDEHQVGVAFRPLSAEQTEYLTLFLRFLDDGVKSPRSRRESTLDKRFG